MPDLFENTFGIFKDVVVPKPQHTITALLQPPGAPRVICGLFAVLAAVGFDDEPDFGTEEIDYVRSDWRLPAKAQAVQLLAAQLAP